MFVYVFSIQEPNEDYYVSFESKTDPIISQSQTKIIPAAFEILQIGHLNQRICFFNRFNYFFGTLQQALIFNAFQVFSEALP